MEKEDCHSIHFIDDAEEIESFYSLFRNMIETTAAEHDKKKSFDGSLCAEDLTKLKEFSRKNEVSQFSQDLAELTTYLEWQKEKKIPAIPETTIYNALLRLEKTLNLSSSTWELLFEEECGGPLTEITNFEMNMMEQAISSYIADLLGDSSQKILFFPLNNLYDPGVIVKWRILEKLASVKLTPETTIYQKMLTEYLRKRIKKEVSDWLKSEFQKLKLTGKSTVLKDLEVLAKILRELKANINVAIDVTKSDKTLFEDAKCNYMDALAEALDEMLYPVCQNVMTQMDAYQLSHKNFHVNMRESSALSHSLYIQLKKIVALLKDHCTANSHLKIEDYKDTFGNIFLNLLYVFKSECHNRIKRAVEAEEKETVPCEEKLLRSSIIVLNCFCTVIDEWNHLEIEDEELQIAFLIKVTDIVCDGAKIYAEALERKTGDPNGKEFAKKEIILMNSVQHVRLYLQQLSEHMQWSASLDLFIRDNADSDLKNQILRILTLIHLSMDSHLKNIEQKIMDLLVSYVQSSCEKLLSSWLFSSSPNQNFNKFMNFFSELLESLLQTIDSKLSISFLQVLWKSLLVVINNELLQGQPPEYAASIKQNIEDLKNHFLQLNMEDIETSKPLYKQLESLLDLNAKTTVELQLNYYSQLAEMVVSPVEYLGHIAFQAGYKNVGEGMVDIYIYVQKGQRLPARKFDLSELYLKIELCPNSLFPTQLPIKYGPVTESSDNPMFNEFFHFIKLPGHLLNIKGAVIQVVISNQDARYNTEAVLLLNQIQNMSGFSSVEFLPVYLLSLRRFDTHHAAFQVLESRSRWDRNAKSFISKRAKMARGQKKFLTCLPGKGSACYF